MKQQITSKETLVLDTLEVKNALILYSICCLLLLDGYCSMRNLVLFSFIDPETKAWLENHKHPIFGFPSLVRFSWGTCTPYFKNLVEVLWSVLFYHSLGIFCFYHFSINSSRACTCTCIYHLSMAICIVSCSII